MMDDLTVELACPGCGREINADSSGLKERASHCPACVLSVPLTDEQIDQAVERRLRAERKALKPKFGGL